MVRVRGEMGRWWRALQAMVRTLVFTPLAPLEGFEQWEWARSILPFKRLALVAI